MLITRPNLWFPYREEIDGDGDATAVAATTEDSADSTAEEDGGGLETVDDSDADEPESINLRELLGERGIDGFDEDASDLAMLTSVLDARTQSDEHIQRLQQQFDEQRRHLDAVYYQQQHPVQQPVVQQPSQAEYQPPSLADAKILNHYENIPEYNSEWANGIERNENGDLVVKQGWPPDTLRDYETYRTWSARGIELQQQDPFLHALEQVIFDPKQRLIQILDARNERRIQYHLGGMRQEQSAATEQQQLTDILESNRSWMIDHDAQGNPSMSDAGNAWVHFTNEAKAAGIIDPVQQNTYAIGNTKVALGRDFTQPQASASKTKKDRQLAFSKQQAMKTSSTGNTLNKDSKPNSPAQNPSLDIMQMLEDDMVAAGHQMSDAAV